MPRRTTSFRDDLLVDLADPIEAASYVNAALDDSEEMFLVALRDVAEARQMAKVAETAGVARESIYRMLTAKSNPTYGSLHGILRAVGLKLAVRPEAEFGCPPSLLSADRSQSVGALRQTQGEAAGLRGQVPAPASVARKDMGIAGSFTGSQLSPASAS